MGFKNDECWISEVCVGNDVEQLKKIKFVFVGIESDGIVLDAISFPSGPQVQSVSFYIISDPYLV